MSAPTIPTHRVMEGEGAATNAQAVPAHVQLVQMATGCWISQLVSTAANLSIADHLAGGRSPLVRSPKLLDAIRALSIGLCGRWIRPDTQINERTPIAF
jgi:hypothetical protein